MKKCVLYMLVCVILVLASDTCYAEADMAQRDFCCDSADMSQLSLEEMEKLVEQESLLEQYFDDMIYSLVEMNNQLDQMNDLLDEMSRQLKELDKLISKDELFQK